MEYSYNYEVLKGQGQEHSKSTVLHVCIISRSARAKDIDTMESSVDSLIYEHLGDPLRTSWRTESNDI